MSTGDPRAHSRGCGGDAAAYVLVGLEPAEADAFCSHLESCVVCRDEVAALQRVVDALPMAAPQYAVPSGLRRRVLRAVRAEPRLGRESVRRRRRAPLRHLLPLSLPRPALAAAALLAVAVLITFSAGLGFVSGRSSSARVIRASVEGPGSAQLNVAGGHGELIVHHLPPPPAGRVYEVWLVKRSHPKRSHPTPSPTSALFSPTSTGEGDVDVPGDLRGVGEVMVTQEPAGGSRSTTHAPVIRARLT